MHNLRNIRFFVRSSDIRAPDTARRSGRQRALPSRFLPTPDDPVPTRGGGSGKKQGPKRPRGDSSRAQAVRERDRDATRTRRGAESQSTRERRLAGDRERAAARRKDEAPSARERRLVDDRKRRIARRQNERLLAAEGDRTGGVLQALSPTELYLQAARMQAQFSPPSIEEGRLRAEQDGVGATSALPVQSPAVDGYLQAATQQAPTATEACVHTSMPQDQGTVRQGQRPSTRARQRSNADRTSASGQAEPASERERRHDVDRNRKAAREKSPVSDRMVPILRAKASSARRARRAAKRQAEAESARARERRSRRARTQRESPPAREKRLAAARERVAAMRRS